VRLVTIGLALGAVVAGACAAEQAYVWVQDLPASRPTRDARIGAGDTIFVEVQEQPAMTGEFQVRDDGMYLQPTLGSVRVEGLTAPEATRVVSARLTQIVVTPRVSVSIVRSRPIRVSVAGEVRTPGNYELDRNRGVVGALTAAGWLTDYAHDDRIFVVRRGGAGARIRFRLADLKAAEPRASEFHLLEGDLVLVE
jgi:polysaccharide export outer membrane protein